MRTIIFFLVFYFVKFLIKELSKPEVSKIDELINAIPNREPIKYYSNGIELPYPFHIEYKMMMNTIANSWMYKEKYQELVNENHDAPIIDREILSPYIQRYTYTFNNVFLAESYMKDQWDYLNNLN
jgi:hypothetical protein